MSHYKSFVCFCARHDGGDRLEFFRFEVAIARVFAEFWIGGQIRYGHICLLSKEVNRKHLRRLRNEQKNGQNGPAFTVPRTYSRRKPKKASLNL